MDWRGHTDTRTMLTRATTNLPLVTNGWRQDKVARPHISDATNPSYYWPLIEATPCGQKWNHAGFPSDAWRAKLEPCLIPSPCGQNWNQSAFCINLFNDLFLYSTMKYCSYGSQITYDPTILLHYWSHCLDQGYPISPAEKFNENFLGENFSEIFQCSQW